MSDGGACTKAKETPPFPVMQEGRMSCPPAGWQRFCRSRGVNTPLRESPRPSLLPSACVCRCSYRKQSRLHVRDASFHMHQRLPYPREGNFLLTGRIKEFVKEFVCQVSAGNDVDGGCGDIRGPGRACDLSCSGPLPVRRLTGQRMIGDACFFFFLSFFSFSPFFFFFYNIQEKEDHSFEERKEGRAFYVVSSLALSLH